MDKLNEREAFLHAIYSVPEDDTPRLIYADFLEENGDPDRAAYIRIECERDRLPPESESLLRRGELSSALLALFRMNPAGWPWGPHASTRGLPSVRRIELRASDLDDTLALRWKVVRETPEWFGATAFKMLPDRALLAEQVGILFELPFMGSVKNFDFSGHVEELKQGPLTEQEGTFALQDLEEQPVITVAAVEEIARSRAARKIQNLILTYNGLDNDAARALVRSPYLINLRRLDLLEGNRLRGQTWQQLLAQFGEDVVG